MKVHDEALSSFTRRTKLRTGEQRHDQATVGEVGEAGEVREGEEGLSDKAGPELRVPGRAAAANRAVCADVPTLILATLVSGPSMSLVKARLQ